MGTQLPGPFRSTTSANVLLLRRRACLPVEDDEDESESGAENEAAVEVGRTSGARAMCHTQLASERSVVNGEVRYDWWTLLARGMRRMRNCARARWGRGQLLGRGRNGARGREGRTHLPRSDGALELERPVLAERVAVRDDPGARREPGPVEVRDEAHHLGRVAACECVPASAVLSLCRLEGGTDAPEPRKTASEASSGVARGRGRLWVERTARKRRTARLVERRTRAASASTAVRQASMTCRGEEREPWMVGGASERGATAASLDKPRGWTCS